MEGGEEFVGSTDQTHQIVRGKRTKRQRAASPFGLQAMTCSSSSGCGGGGGGGGGDQYYGSTSSATTTSSGGGGGGGGEVYESTEEEEDMANCLILLAQGGVPVRRIEESKAGRMERCSSRKFTEIMAATASTAGKVGFYVYECKTCNRTFPSFQALGGHRASHKKPKTATTVVEEKKPAAAAAISIPILQSATTTNSITTDHDQFDDVKFNKNCHSPPPPPPPTHQIANNNSNNRAFHSNNNKSNKIHECSICGSEFTSGQALGGHMRRHRAAAVSAATTTQVTTMISSIDTNTTTTTADHHRHHQQEENQPRNILQLDLNLPAPEDDLRDSSSKFQFASAKQSLVFAAPALVDCHY